jgi:hypothetical protein
VIFFLCHQAGKSENVKGESVQPADDPGGDTGRPLPQLGLALNQEVKVE